MSLEKMNDFFDARAEAYDNHMLVDLGLDEFYEEIAKQINPSKPDFKLLDLGCGTGIELERLFARFPAMSVVGVDLSSGMLEQLKIKYPHHNIQTICGSYFDVPFDGAYDVVLSTYSLHHWNETEKLPLYKKIYDAVADDGLFIEGDYTCKTVEQEQCFQIELARLRAELNLPESEFYHFDTPLTAKTQMSILQSVGFSKVKLVREWENTSIITAER